jgi:hypothetical protein
MVLNEGLRKRAVKAVRLVHRGTSSSSNCGSRSWKPAKPKRSARPRPKTSRFRSGKETGQSSSPCRTACRGMRSCTNRCTTGPVPVLLAAATWPGLAKTSPKSSTNDGQAPIFHRKGPVSIPISSFKRTLIRRGRPQRASNFDYESSSASAPPKGDRGFESISLQRRIGRTAKPCKSRCRL